MIMLLLKSLVMGFVMAAPVGPVGVLCLRRSLKAGWSAGFVTGFAVAVVDGIFGLVSSVGLNSVTEFLKDHEEPLRLFGGLILLVVAFFVFRHPPANLKSKDENDGEDDSGHAGIGRLVRYFFSALLLALSNPLAIFSFAAIYIGLGLGSTIASDPLFIFIFVCGIITGSSGWFALLSGGAAHFRERLSDHLLTRINQICGAMIAIFGLYSFVSAFTSAA